MAENIKAGNQSIWQRYPIAFYAGVLAILLSLFFFRSFDPNYVVFSNDGPLGGLMASVNKMPDVLTGAWHDINWIGSQSPTPAINVTSMLRLFTTPLLFSKIFAPFSLFFLGIGAWAFFRKLGFGQSASVLGGLAASLSSHFLSTSCWGVASQIIAIGADFMALALISDNSSRKQWIRIVLAGMAVGINIMEGYDIGAIFSLYVAAYVAYQSLISAGPPAQKLVKGIIRLVLVAGFAAFMASEALLVLVSTQIQGIAGTEQNHESKEARWDFATQWSMPKNEVFRIIIPGLFGYRMDTPKDMVAFDGNYKAGHYWGKVGETPGWSENHTDPEWSRAHKGAYPRFSGGGEYCGLLVFVLAVWALCQAMRKSDSIYSLTERRFIKFWAIAAFVSLLFAFGRYAPFYRLVYALPYFSTIRNPAKFMHPFHWCMVILFAYGVEGLCRGYLNKAGRFASADLMEHVKLWWKKAGGFEQKWNRASLLAIAASLFGWLMYATQRSNLEKHLLGVGFGDPTLAADIASFSIGEVGLYILFLLVTVGLLTVALSGWFASRRARVGITLLGILLVMDLARADLPWIIYQDWKTKYASNDVIDFLREKSFEHRVVILPFQAGAQHELLDQLYRIEWAQHHFQYYDIQSLDIIQMPRTPVDMVAYEGALQIDATDSKTSMATAYRIARRWQLTNTRYIFGAASLLDVLNHDLDPQGQRFKIARRFDIAPKPGIANPTKLEELTAVLKPDGQFALFDFTGALPRASLYSNWQNATNDSMVLEQLRSPNFNAGETLFVNGLEPVVSSTPTNSTPGTVEFVSYSPKHINLRAKTPTSSVLLLNDRYDPNWTVLVDGQPAKLMRCNYIMRGVALTPGDHNIKFDFHPSKIGLYISLVAIALSAVLLGILVVLPSKSPDEELSPPSGRAPSKAALQPQVAKK